MCAPESCFFLGIQQKNRRLLALAAAAGGLDLGIGYSKGRADKTGAHDGEIRSRGKDEPKDKCLKRTEHTHRDNDTHAALMHLPVCICWFL